MKTNLDLYFNFDSRQVSKFVTLPEYSMYSRSSGQTTVLGKHNYARFFPTFLSSLSQLMYDAYPLFNDSDEKFFNVGVSTDLTNVATRLLLIVLENRNSNSILINTTTFGNVLNYMSFSMYEMQPFTSMFYTTEEWKKVNSLLQEVYNEINEAKRLANVPTYTRHNGKVVAIADMATEHIFSALKRMLIEDGLFTEEELSFLKRLSTVDAYQTLIIATDDVFDSMDIEGQYLVAELENRILDSSLPTVNKVLQTSTNKDLNVNKTDSFDLLTFVVEYLNDNDLR